MATCQNAPDIECNEVVITNAKRKKKINRTRCFRLPLVKISTIHEKSLVFFLFFLHPQNTATPMSNAICDRTILIVFYATYFQLLCNRNPSTIVLALIPQETGVPKRAHSSLGPIFTGRTACELGELLKHNILFHISQSRPLV